MNTITLFDYSGKTTEWLVTLRGKLGMFAPDLRDRVRDSITAELAKRGGMGV